MNTNAHTNEKRTMRRIAIFVVAHLLVAASGTTTGAQPVPAPAEDAATTTDPAATETDASAETAETAEALEQPAADAAPEAASPDDALPPPDADLAEDLAAEEEETEPLVQRINLQIHGFVSQGFIFTLRNNYLTHSRRNGSFEMAEAGINLTVQPIDNLRIGVQLFARDLGPIGNYDIKLDWFYLDYRFADWFGVRAGRTKIPFGLYNEINDVDVARVPILLPQSTYPTQNRDFLLSQTGGEIYGRVPLGIAGALEYRIYGGTIFLDVQNSASSPISIVSLSVPYVIGGRLMWETPLSGLRVGGSVQGLKLESDLVIATMPVSVDIPAVLWMVSAEYTDGRLLLASEYSRWHTRVESSNEMIYPETSTVSERAYVMASYQIASFFHPGMYYSLYYPNVEVRDGRASRQHDVAVTLRFDINRYWLVKLEAHYLEGTAYVSPALNGGLPASMSPGHWAAFLLRTTGYF